jgi:hypothetical protein
MVDKTFASGAAEVRALRSSPCVRIFDRSLFPPAPGFLSLTFVPGGSIKYCGRACGGIGTALPFGDIGR